MELWHSVTGLSVPTASNDLTVVDIEPTAGVPTQAKRIMQINVGMVKGSLRFTYYEIEISNNYRFFSVTENTTNVVVPVLWMNETAYFDQGTRDQLINIFNAKHYSFIGGVISLSLGLIAWLAVFVVIIVYSVIILLLVFCKIQFPLIYSDNPTKKSTDVLCWRMRTKSLRKTRTQFWHKFKNLNHF